MKRLTFLLFVLALIFNSTSQIYAQSESFYAVDTEAISEKVDSIMKHQNIPGVAIGIVVNDQLEYFLPYGLANKSENIEITPNTGFQIASITKPVLATLAVKLQSEGRIDLNKPIANYLPKDIVPESTIPITLAHLLSHSSGLPESAINRKDIPETPTVPYPYSIKKLYLGLPETFLLFEPGTFYQYSNIGMKLAGHVMEAATDVPLETLLKTELLDPLEMNSTYARNKPEHLVEAAHYWRLDDAKAEQKRWVLGEVWGSGGITSTISDFARYVSLQFKRSESTASIVPPDYLKLSHRAKNPTWRTLSSFIGLGWFVKYDNEFGNMIYHTGDADGHSSYTSLLHEDGIGIIVFANKGSVADEIGEEIESIAFEHIVKLKEERTKAFYENDHEKMIEVCEKMISINPSNSRAHYFLGRSYYETSQFEKIEQPMLEALSGKTLIDYAHFYLASFYAFQNQEEKAYWHLTQAVNLGFIDGDRLLDDQNLSIFEGTESYKKLARWGHH